MAVTIPSSGYRNSHHHWCPMASTISASSGASDWVAKMAWIVGTAMARMMRAGITVQAISSFVLP